MVLTAFAKTSSCQDKLRPISKTVTKESQHRPPGQRWILEEGLRAGGPGTPPFWRTWNEFFTVWNSVRGP
jgi:hypothetical protein